MRADGTVAYQPTPGGLLIGIMDDPPFSAATIRLSPGDTLLLYTDGLTEAHTQSRPSGPSTTDGACDTADGRYGEDALLTFAAGLAPTTALAAITAVSGLLAGLGDGLDDDTAVLALSVPATADATAQKAAAPVSAAGEFS